MSYGADFVTADPANAPLDAPILVGADPAMVVAGVLLMLAACALGWFFGNRTHRNGGDATASIWHAIDKAAKEAMKADDHALRGKADHLAETLRRRLGKTLEFTAGDDGLAAAFAGLTAALAGRKPDEKHDDHGHGHDDHAHDGHGHDDHHDEAHQPHDSAHAPPATASASTGSVTIVNVIPSAAPAPGQHQPPKKPGLPHGPKEMTAREQTAALRLAVAAFNEHWRHESARVGQMRAMLAELTG